MDTKDAYKKKLEAEMAEWDAKIKLLAAKSENAAADMRVKYAHELDKLRNKRGKASDKLKELEESSGEAWHKVKITADQMWDDLKSSIASAVSKFK